MGRAWALPRELKQDCYQLVGELRTALARAGVNRLEPDLVILDEFQRFRHLLDVADGGEAAELAHHLFDYGAAKVLLLSATPYKPFTLADEAIMGEDHHRDFRRMLTFLDDDRDWNAEVGRALEAYRDAVVNGRDAEAGAARVRRLLLRVMCRTERPAVAQTAMLRERRLDAKGPAAERNSCVRNAAQTCSGGRCSYDHRVLEVGAVLPQLHRGLPVGGEASCCIEGRETI
jgi:hypothetical protein